MFIKIASQSTGDYEAQECFYELILLFKNPEFNLQRLNGMIMDIFSRLIDYKFNNIISYGTIHYNVEKSLGLKRLILLAIIDIILRVVTTCYQNAIIKLKWW